MFLNRTIEKNQNLIKTAIDFHRSGEISPNSYILDVDSIKSNVINIVKKARELDISLYMMTKQLGRNPVLAKLIAQCGIDKAVAVDPWEAIKLAEQGIRLGNVGHLVQIPSGMIQRILEFKPEVITVYTVEKAKEISNISLELGMIQDIILKVVGSDDMIYDGQVGGFKEDDLIQKAREIQTFSGVNIVGVTAFPCFLYNDDACKILPTNNAFTVIKCAKKLKNELNIDMKQINMPSANTIESISLIKDMGGTHGEPGHALTGTTPFHESGITDEIPSMVYLSEISHCFDNKAYVYGGGFYKRSKMTKAMVGKDFENMKKNILEVEEIASDAIDYYGTLKIGDKKVSVGDTVIYSFRTQIFVTRSEVVLVEGLQSNNPKIIGVYDSYGNKKR